MMELRQCRPADLPRLLPWITTEQALVQWAGPRQFSFPLTLAQLDAYLQGAGNPSGSRVVFAATDEGRGPYGVCELGAIDRGAGTATLCRIMVAPDARGKGLGGLMVREVVRRGFEELGLRRLELRVYAFNTPAIWCYADVGFRVEAVLRQSTRVGDDRWDALMMAILAEDWARRSGARVS